MSSSDALLQHIVGRMQADIDFLVSQGVLSAADGHLITSKLPSGQVSDLRTMPTPMTSPSPSPFPSAPSLASSARRVVPPPPPPPPTYSSQPQARAIWAYETQDAGDLSFAAGETIDIVEETNADWWKGRNARGETGLFPSNYVEKIAATNAPGAVPALPNRRMVAPISNEKASYDPMVSAPPQPPVQQQEVPQKKGKFGKYGNTMAHSAAGGVGFGAGAAIGSGIINSIF
ncbi:SH3 domain-containing protein [Hysterangium stoloniferum]|nr:SH3 domain-containing protein [Hysterangium stoloniferum]